MRQIYTEQYSTPPFDQENWSQKQPQDLPTRLRALAAEMRGVAKLDCEFWGGPKNPENHSLSAWAKTCDKMANEIATALEK